MDRGLMARRALSLTGTGCSLNALRLKDKVRPRLECGADGGPKQTRSEARRAST